MLSSVLNSDRAIEVNIAIMRAFVRLREILSTHKDLARKLDALERKLAKHDDKFTVVFDAIRQMMEPPPGPKKRRIGFCRSNRLFGTLLVPLAMRLQFTIGRLLVATTAFVSVLGL